MTTVLLWSQRALDLRPEDKQIWRGHEQSGIPWPEVLEAATHWSFLFPDLCFLHTASKGPWDPVGNDMGMKVFGKL